MAGKRQHQALADELIAAIADGTHPVGSRFPTEARLCERSGLSRGTVRQALAALEELGLIERRPGAGSRVIAARPLGAYTPLVTTSDDIVRMVRHTRLVEVESAETVLDAAAARALGVEDGSRWFRICGLRVETGGQARPLGWNEQLIRADLPASSRQVLLRGSIESSDLAASEIEQEIRAEPVPAELADRLRTVAGSPALVVVRRYRREGRVTTVSRHLHPGDRFSISTTLVPGTATERQQEQQGVTSPAPADRST